MQSFIKNLSLIIGGISGAITVLSVLLRLFYKRHQNSKTAYDLVEYQFDYQNVKSKRDFYIDTQGQNITPSIEEEAETSSAFIVKKKLIPFFLKIVFKKKEKDKFYLILADSGMGKTTFMINLYLQYNSFFRLGKKYKMRLLPFGYKGIIEKIKEIKRKEDASQIILLLDAFDEYKKLLPPSEPDGLTDEERFSKTLDEVLDIVQDFREVIITSRTQYFPGQEDKPYKLEIPRFDEEGFHTLVKLYISPFDEKEIKCYLNKKYGVLKFWNFKKKHIAQQIISSSSKLMVRPMLLSYIDYLVDPNHSFSNTYQIYETLINKWIKREGDKREHNNFNCEKLKQNLHKYSQLIAVKIYENRKLNNILYLSKADAIDVNIELKDYQMTGHSLLIRDPENNWKFAHKSILEYFLAKEAIENIEFAMKLDFVGLDMTKLFYSEMAGSTSFNLSNYVLIKGAKFLMGSSENVLDRERMETIHSVLLSDFYICRYAVTVSDFKKFIKDTNYRTDAEEENSSKIYDGKKWVDKEGINWNFGIAGKYRNSNESNHPVLHVSWNDAIAFCEWLSNKIDKTFRLPSEAEWEFACRAGTTTPFNTGDNLTTEQANYNGNFPYHENRKGIFRYNTVPVNSLQPNAWGLFNMHGNVWEWCNDYFSYHYYDQCKQKCVENPTGPISGSSHVVRGGAWCSFAQRCRSARRDDDITNFRSDIAGFRLVFNT